MNYGCTPPVAPSKRAAVLNAIAAIFAATPPTQHGWRIPVNDLAGAIGVDRQTVHKHVTRAIADGLLTRHIAYARPGLDRATGKAHPKKAVYLSPTEAFTAAVSKESR